MNKGQETERMKVKEDVGELTEEDRKELINGDSFLGKPEAIIKFVRISLGWYALKRYYVVNGEIVSDIVEQNSYWNVHGELWRDRNKKDVVGHVEFDHQGGTIFLYKPDLYSRRLIKILGEDQYWTEVLSHESLHLVIHKVAGSKATIEFDNLKNDDDGDWAHDEVGYVAPKDEDTWHKAKEIVLDSMKRQLLQNCKLK